MNIVSDVFMQFFAAWLFGIVDAWNRKVSFFVLVAICIAYVIYGSLGNSIVSGSWLEALWRVGVTVIGIWAGQLSYKQAFKKNGG